MNYKNTSHKLGLINPYLVILFAFCLPVSTAATSILAPLILVVWIAEGNLKNKIKIIFDNKIALMVSVYILLHFIGLLWTQDFDSGIHVLSKQWKLFLLPVLLTIIKKEHIRLYCYAFIAAMVISVSLSYLVWLELIDFKDVLPTDPTVFIDRISYNIFLCVAIFMTIQLYMLDKKHHIPYIVLIIVMTINMFITNGRTGQIAFFSMIPIVLLQYFKNDLKKSLLAVFIIPFIFLSAYYTSTNFENRINLTVNSIKNLAEDPDPDTSIGARFTFLKNSLEMIMNNPVIGVGTGDFELEYGRINNLRSPKMTDTDNPHNQYLLVLAQFGILGFLVFLSIFYYQLKYAVSWQDDWQYMRVFILVLYLVIMLGETYLMEHHASLLFSLLTAVYFNKLISYSNLKA